MGLSKLKNITEQLLTENEPVFLICLLYSLHILS